jgi:hypothetical protein
VTTLPQMIVHNVKLESLRRARTLIRIHISASSRNFQSELADTENCEV